MHAEKLTGSQAQAALRGRPYWRIEGGKLRRDFRFSNFVEAFGFMAKVALQAEALNHHPDWRNSFGLVEIELTTHDAGGMTTLDFEMAGRIDAMFQG